jgi:hypothetical protein
MISFSFDLVWLALQEKILILIGGAILKVSIIALTATIVLSIVGGPSVLNPATGEKEDDSSVKAFQMLISFIPLWVCFFLLCRFSLVFAHLVIVDVSGPCDFIVHRQPTQKDSRIKHQEEQQRCVNFFIPQPQK